MQSAEYAELQAGCLNSIYQVWDEETMEWRFVSTLAGAGNSQAPASPRSRANSWARSAQWRRAGDRRGEGGDSCIACN